MFRIPGTWLTRAVKVCVVGAGGNGGAMLTGLAKLHMSLLAKGHPYGLRVTVYDDDTVSESNVGRQQFYPSDVGMNKAVVLCNRINLCYGLAFEAIPARFKCNSYQPYDLIVGCVDSAASRRSIHQCANWTLWLDCGNSDATGQIVLGENWKHVQYNRLPTVVDLFPELLDPNVKEDDSPSCSLAEALERQELFVNQAVVTQGLQMLWQLFTRGELAYSAVFVNLNAARVVPLAIDPKIWAKRFGYHCKAKRGSRQKVAA